MEACKERQAAFAEAVSYFPRDTACFTIALCIVKLLVARDTTRLQPLVAAVAIFGELRRPAG